MVVTIQNILHNRKMSISIPAMRTLLLIALFINCARTYDYNLQRNPLASDKKSTFHHLNSVILNEEYFENLYQQIPNYWIDKDNPNNRHAPHVSSVSVSSLEIASDTEDRDHLNRDFFSPNAPLSEEQLFSSNNFSFTLNNNCSTNSTGYCPEPLHAPKFQNSTLTKGLVLSVIAVFSFVGNVATLASIFKGGRQGASTVYMLLSQLAIADLLVTFFCILAEGLWTLTVEWYGGNLLCKAVKFMQMFSLYLSTFVLVLIGFDRLCAVRFPMHRAHAKCLVRRGIVGIWILSGIFSTPQIAIFSVLRGPFVEEFYQCVTYAFYTALWQEQLYTTLTLIFMFLLPLIILITTYITTFLTIASRKKMFSERITRTPIDDARHKILHKAKIKSLMITVVIVLTFVVCWTPYYIMMIIFMFLDPDEQLSQDLQSAIFFFGSSTAMLNPLIYGAFHLRTRKKTRSKSTSYNSSSSRVDNSLVNTCRRNHTRKAHGGTMSHHINGYPSHFVERHSIIVNRNTTIIRQQVSSF